MHVLDYRSPEIHVNMLWSCRVCWIQSPIVVKIPPSSCIHSFVVQKFMLTCHEGAMYVGYSL